MLAIVEDIFKYFWNTSVKAYRFVLKHLPQALQECKEIF